MDDPQKSWQMPQGGIDRLENPMRAALRELHEETGMTSCRIVASVRCCCLPAYRLPVSGRVCAFLCTSSGNKNRCCLGSSLLLLPLLVLQIDHWLEYTWPTRVRAEHQAGSWLRYRGQTQKWYLIEYEGDDDSEIDLGGAAVAAEFSEYAWTPLSQLPEEVVEFKRDVYRQVARHFGPEIQRRCAAAAAKATAPPSLAHTRA